MGSCGFKGSCRNLRKKQLCLEKEMGDYSNDKHFTRKDLDTNAMEIVNFIKIIRAPILNIQINPLFLHRRMNCN